MLNESVAPPTSIMVSLSSTGIVFLVLTALVYCVPLGDKKCSLTVPRSNGTPQLVFAILKDHHCSLENNFLKLFDKNTLEEVNSRQNTRAVCIGLSSLVSFGMKRNLLDGICSKATASGINVRILRYNISRVSLSCFSVEALPKVFGL